MYMSLNLIYYMHVFGYGVCGFWFLKPVMAQNCAVTGNVVYKRGCLIRKPLRAQIGSYVPLDRVLTPLNTSQYLANIMQIIFQIYAGIIWKI